MKIALVILHADPARGGAERYTLDLAAGLVKRGHDVSILASSFQSQPIAGTPVPVALCSRTRTGRHVEFTEKVDAEIEKTAFDVVHAMLPVRNCDIYHPHAGIASDTFRRGHSTKSGALNRAVAWVGNRTNARRRRFAAVERSLLTGDCPPVVLCLSNLIREVVRREYPALPAEKSVSLFNGIDLRRFDPALYVPMRQEIRNGHQIPGSAVVGLFLAQDFERKGLGEAIEALAAVKDLRLTLLVGGKPDPTRYQRLAGSLGVSKRVNFVGPVSNPPAFYHAADFFVLPTRFDPCSLVVLEALAMGLPVISTIRNGACEIMQDGVHGRVLNQADDLAGLSDGIRGMLDLAHRAEMSEACVALRPKLSQETHLDRLEGIYAQIVTNRRA